jgi:hypothetical protein
MDILSLTEAMELGHRIRIESGILYITQNIDMEISKEQRLKLLEDIGGLGIQPLFMISKVKTCNANVVKEMRKPTLLVDFEAFPYTKGCYPHAWFNIYLSNKNSKRWHAPAKGALMDLFKMMDIRCPPSKAQEYIGQLKKRIYTAKYHHDLNKKDKIVNNSIILADISYEEIIRGIEARKNLEIFANTLRNSTEINPKICSETSSTRNQQIPGFQESSSTCNKNYEDKCTGDSETSSACMKSPSEQTTEEWLHDYFGVIDNYTL